MPIYRGLSFLAITFALSTLLSFPALAAEADSTQGHGQHGGHHMMGGGGGHRGPANDSANLSEEQAQKIEQEKQAFQNDSRDLKAQIFQKNLELMAEIAKLQPDTKKAVELQKELSNMEAQLDRKYIDHILRIKVINPYMVIGHDMMRSGGMGHGSMGSSGMGQGSMGCGMMGGGMGGMGKRSQN
jgi:Spy/CpxP family protein refolding chaperone